MDDLGAIREYTCSTYSVNLGIGNIALSKSLLGSVIVVFKSLNIGC